MAKKQASSLLEMAKNVVARPRTPIFSLVSEQLRGECMELAESIASGQVTISNATFRNLLRDQGVAVSKSYIRDQMIRYREERQQAE